MDLKSLRFLLFDKVEYPPKKESKTEIQRRIRIYRYIGYVWLSLGFLLILLIVIFTLMHYQWISDLLNMRNPFGKIFKFILPLLVLFSLSIMLAPGFAYFDWASILERSLERPIDKLLARGPFDCFVWKMAALTPFIIIITLFIVSFPVGLFAALSFLVTQSLRNGQKDK